MPTYGYRCPACGHTFEKFHKMSDDCCPACPKCSVETERVITGGAGLVFKGSGFYITDYGKDGKKAAPSADGGSAAPAEQPAKQQSDAKADAKADTKAATTPKPKQTGDDS